MGRLNISPSKEGFDIVPYISFQLLN